MTQQKRILFCWTVSHHSASIEYRETISPAPDQLDLIYTSLYDEDWINELTVVSTCNRLEIYGASYEAHYQKLTAIVAKILKVNPVELFEKSKTLEDKQALIHLFSVTAGLDSQIVGETEITGQVKQAFLYAAKQRSIGTRLNKAFQKSFQTTKWIRSNTNIGKGQINVTTVAVDLAIKVFGRLHNSAALVIGAGDIAEKTITTLQSRGVKKLTLCNRTFEKAQDLANTHGGRVVPFESLDCHLLEADVVLCSTASPEFILTESRINSFLRKRSIRPLCLLDLALPRDIDPGITLLPNIFLYNLDDLAEIADSNLNARKEELGKCIEHIEKKVAQLTDNQGPSGTNRTANPDRAQPT